MACLESYRRTEPANGSGEIHYFQKDRIAIADPEKLLDAVDRTLEEGQRLSVKLGQTESPKDQFFIKQELINWQEGLRALFLRVVKMCEKSSWSAAPLHRGRHQHPGPAPPARAAEHGELEQPRRVRRVLREHRPRSARLFQARIEPRLPYLWSLMREIEED